MCGSRLQAPGLRCASMCHPGLFRDVWTLATRAMAEGIIVGPRLSKLQQSQAIGPRGKLLQHLGIRIRGTLGEYRPSQ